MTIKVEVKNNKERDYPFIGISSIGTLVLFTEPGTGLVLSKGSTDYGRISRGYEMKHFENFNGEITLSND